MSGDVEIVPLTATQWRDLQRLRIAALTESPDAFAPTAAAARSYDDAYWQRAAERAAGSESLRLYVARHVGVGCGLASAQRDAAGVGHVGAMWVDPERRGAGIGARLFDAAVAFLQGSGCREIRLSVTETNTRAVALYRSRGFVMTGEWEPLRAQSPLKNLCMCWRAQPDEHATDGG